MIPFEQFDLTRNGKITSDHNLQSMSLDSLLVSGTMSTDVKKQTDDQNIMGACKIMHDNNIGSVIIVGLEDPEMNPIGIITERDIVRILGKLEPWQNRMPLRTIMSKPVITIESTASLAEAMDKMNSYNIRRLVVVNDENKMIGIITEKDIFKEFAKNPALMKQIFGNKFLKKHKDLYEKFADSLSDILPK
jgi:CBS domain-containing protein